MAEVVEAKDGVTENEEAEAERGGEVVALRLQEEGVLHVVIVECSVNTYRLRAMRAARKVHPVTRWAWSWLLALAGLRLPCPRHSPHLPTLHSRHGRHYTHNYGLDAISQGQNTRQHCHQLTETTPSDSKSACISCNRQPSLP